MLRIENATEKINIHITLQKVPQTLVSWMGRLTGIWRSQSKNQFKAKAGESLTHQANIGAPVLTEIQLSRRYYFQSLLQENLQEIQKEFPGLNQQKLLIWRVLHAVKWLYLSLWSQKIYIFSMK